MSTAQYSDCETYRYALTRVWDDAGKRVVFVMLNPSKANEIANDPTVERCERRARALGFGAFRVVNIFAFRETNPHLMRKATSPVGPDNDAILHTNGLGTPKRPRYFNGVPHGFQQFCAIRVYSSFSSYVIR